MRPVSAASATGSSPLTRGKRADELLARRSKRLIPAHAGKTQYPMVRRQESEAHPRSRGENTLASYRGAKLSGSSPLTRGKHHHTARGHQEDRLIPAHAGKTPIVLHGHRSQAAHPRSRGENVLPRLPSADFAGSSPLTRGKLQGSAVDPCRAWLIPAHAGKTGSHRRTGQMCRAHPRSRGENGRAAAADFHTNGSSPLTRGKLDRVHALRVRHRLIPAHAGKTTCLGLRTSATPAHPRSRGENAARRLQGRRPGGSSPLTRGKPRTGFWSGATTGLIPAHAGKTRMRTSSISPSRAHPRSRGENRTLTLPAPRPSGSSPLTRGKLELGFSAPQVFRLIPAHAGKTRFADAAGLRAPAHPRSRGENNALGRRCHVGEGSSPLTRGKPPRRVRPRRRYGLIPAHAGKTGGIVFAWNYSAAHPRSRGENDRRRARAPGLCGSSPLTRGKLRRH